MGAVSQNPSLHPAIRGAGVRISTRPDCVPIDLGLLARERRADHRIGGGILDDECCGAADGVTPPGTRRGLRANPAARHHAGDSSHVRPAGADGTVVAANRGPGRVCADLVRIAPTLVLKDTPLERLYRRGAYHAFAWMRPSSRCAYGYQAFHRRESSSPAWAWRYRDSQGTARDKAVAGPWHPALRHEVESRLACQAIGTVLKQTGARAITVNQGIFRLCWGRGVPISKRGASG